MFKISVHICEMLNEKGIQFERIEMFNRERILERVLNKFCENFDGNWIWERLKQYSTLSDDMAWEHLKDFIGENECIMFFNQNEEKEMFLIHSGNDLNIILAETCGFEFYITDRECTYLLAYNHHDILYGCGTAIDWMEKSFQAASKKS